MLGILPAQPLNSKTPPSPPSLIKPDVLGTHNDEATISGEIEAQEAKSELVGTKVPVLMYHYIRPMPDCSLDKLGCSLTVTPKIFEAQLSFLVSHGWTAVTLDTLAASFRDPTILPAKPVVLTFDDGYEDFYTTAFPIIKRYGLPATIYVLAEGERMNLVQGYGHYMSDTQIRELSISPLITVAAHTVDHSSLKGRSAYLQYDQIFRSKSEIESIIGKPVNHFAYPYGAFDAVTIKYVREAGFVTAASTIAGAINSESTRYSLHRVRIGSGGPSPLAWFADALAKN